MDEFPHAIASLGDLDAAMAASREPRVRLAVAILAGRAVDPADVAVLRTLLAAIQAAPSGDGRTHLAVAPGMSAAFDLSFEIHGLEEDFVFCTEGEAALEALFADRIPEFAAEVAGGLKILSGRRWRCLLADRDGTLLDYCGRYASSTQPAWNAVYLARFCRACCERAVLLTSGPLAGAGVESVTTLPAGTMDLAASKGREWLAADGRRGAVPLHRAADEMLATLAERLSALLARSEYAVFGRIGSGFQRKRGELTVARQDAFASIPPAASMAFLDLVRRLVSETDPSGTTLALADTGLDIEIGLAAAGRAFDKGQALEVLDHALGLDLAHGPHLVCGDTAADLPMLRAALARTPEVDALFVTREAALAAEVRSLCPEAVCVDSPATLMAILNGLAER